VVGFLVEPAYEGLKNSVEDVHIVLTVTPGRVGSNHIIVTLTDRRGTPMRNASQVELRLSALEADVGERVLSAAAHGDGTYVLDDVLLSLVGQWQMQLVVRRPDAFDARTVFRFVVIAESASGGATIMPAPGTGTLLWGGALLLLGGLCIVTSIPLRGARTSTGRLVMGLGAACGVMALLFFATRQ
jgi:hypothetical protein